ncbi:hypothetical protein TNCV_1511691 [Trichonephila clavipes]|nr:hypothetical protein TNCV_1511691 [Trichonephila clavipes]
MELVILNYGQMMRASPELATPLQATTSRQQEEFKPQQGWSGASHLSSPSTNLTRGLEARQLFRVTPCCEGTIHLQASMPSPGFKPRPNGTAVSVINHYTWWAALKL